jgi:hypothetical protein
MDQQMLLDMARLVSRQSTLLLALSGMMLVGMVVLGVELYAIMRGLQGIATSVQAVAQMTTEALEQRKHLAPQITAEKSPALLLQGE